MKEADRSCWPLALPIKNAAVHTPARILIIALLVVHEVIAAGQTRATGRFGSETFSLVLPDGYAPVSAVNGPAGTVVFPYSTAPRKDGTRGLIQVTLIDLSKAEKDYTLDEMSELAIGGIERRRSAWSRKDSTVTVAGAPAKRMEWSGRAVSADSASLMMRGVMIVGIKGRTAYWLHTQEVEPHFANLPAGEKALLSFEVGGK